MQQIALKIISLIALAVAGIFFVQMLGKAIDHKVDATDAMLCNSALKSGNEFYLEKCQCYYATGNVACMR